MNISETAELLGISEGMVKTRPFRARLLMQKIRVVKQNSHDCSLYLNLFKIHRTESSRAMRGFSALLAHLQL